MTRTGMVETPIGTIRVDVEDGAVVAIHLPERPRDGSPLASANASADRERGSQTSNADLGSRLAGASGDEAVLAEACRQLSEYFDGKRTAFDLPLRPAGTPFQQAVWVALRAIPAGETRSYADIARAVGRPSAVRAVGAANGANPIAIVVPCHRVIGSSGALTGYAGGLPTKKWLLAFEGRLSAPLLRLADASRR
jgi:methylated-DNA-[protein]-cysteine S-methyltransferase